MERLHHTRKEVLSHEHYMWEQLSKDSVRFIEEVVDHCGGVLSNSKWKKLYACLAEFAQLTQINFRVYQSEEGYWYDTTTHTFTSAAELEQEKLHQDVEAGLSVEDEQLLTLKRWKLELEQLDIKIQAMTVKRKALADKYEATYHQFIGALQI